jgi:hypothetical protein
LPSRSIAPLSASAIAPKSELAQRARPIVLHEHVGRAYELLDELEAARVPEIHAQPLLAHVLLQKVAALAIEEVRVVPARVTGRRALDLDDFGAQPGETAGQIRSGQKMRVVDDADASERQRLRRHESLR